MALESMDSGPSTKDFAEAAAFSSASRVMGADQFVNVKIRTPVVDGSDIDKAPCAFTIGADTQPFTLVGTLPQLGHTFRAFARACDSLEKELKDDIFVERIFDA